jgi:hypothetical protein
MSTIKLKKDLLQKVKRVAAAGGYSSLEDAQSDEEIVRKLKGLGYID